MAEERESRAPQSSSVSDIVSGAIVGASAGAALGTFLVPVPFVGTIGGAILGGGLNAFLKRSIHQRVVVNSLRGKPELSR